MIVKIYDYYFDSIQLSIPRRLRFSSPLLQHLFLLGLLLSIVNPFIGSFHKRACFAFRFRPSLRRSLFHLFVYQCPYILSRMFWQIVHDATPASVPKVRCVYPCLAFLPS